MRSSYAALGLVSLAIAAPSCPNPGSNLSSSKGLKLRVKLQDASKDLTSPVKGQFVTSIHDGAGTNLVGFSASEGRIFYVNGTAGGDGLFWNTLSDGATPLVPFGLSLHAAPENADVQIVRLDAGPGDEDIYVPEHAASPQLYPTNWLACSEPLQYYGGQKFNVLRRQALGTSTPSECVLITLLPECTALNDLPPGSYASHEFAREVSCYKDASNV